VKVADPRPLRAPPKLGDQDRTGGANAIHLLSNVRIRLRIRRLTSPARALAATAKNLAP